MTALEGVTLLAALFGAIGVPIGAAMYIKGIDGRQEAHEKECRVIREAHERELTLIVDRLRDSDAALAQRFDDQHSAVMVGIQSIREAMERRA